MSDNAYYPVITMKHFIRLYGRVSQYSKPLVVSCVPTVCLHADLNRLTMESRLRGTGCTDETLMKPLNTIMAGLFPM